LVVGIDIGGSTTDIVGFDGREVAHPISVTASDPIASAAGALGRFLDAGGYSLSSIRQIGITGVGATHLGHTLLGIPVVSVDEFTCIGRGGTFLAGVDDAIVVSMGTGTAIVHVRGGHATHWGGTGVGGGTLAGLARSILGTTEIRTVVDLAKEGSLARVDLTVGEIAGGPVNGLPPTATAANFARVSDRTSKPDVALGLINLVCQTIGVLAVSAARETGSDLIILTGKVSELPQARPIFDSLGKLYGRKMQLPEHAGSATAVGAAVSIWK